MSGPVETGGRFRSHQEVHLSTEAPGPLADQTGRLQAILSRHAPPLRRYLGRRLPDAASAEEATQETLVRAFVRWPSLREPERPEPWLYGIARRVAAEMRRDTRRRAARFEVGALEADRLAAGTDPELGLLAAESGARLESALLELSEHRRRALLLRVDQELGYPEIAERLGWSLAKVKNEIHRARNELRRALALGAVVLLAVAALARIEARRAPPAAVSSELRACVSEVEDPICDEAISWAPPISLPPSEICL
jgi:RNA polymerase sigma-70 factor (ECF subfamily)